MTLVWIAPAATLTAAPGEHDPAASGRDRSGLAVPWDVYGNTSAGRLRVRRGAIRVPDALGQIKLLRGHRGGPVDPEPVGYLVSADDTDAGLAAVLHFANTPAGQAALVEADERVRDALSVELDNLETSGDEVIGADLVALGLVPVGAFTAARLAAEMISAVAAVPPTGDQPVPDTDPGPALITAADPAPALTAAAEVPPTLRPAAPPEPVRTMADLYRLLTAAHTASPSHAAMTAALVPITHTANKWVQSTQYEGELWDGVDYQRQIVPLITSGTLTSYTVAGWRWSDPPTVGPWAGDKTAVPSDTATTVAVSLDAKRLAGAHDLDRKFRDFNDTGFFESYYRAMAASYAEQSDMAAATDLVNAATAFTQTVGASAWQTIVQMSMSLGRRGPATFALVGANVALSLAGVTTAEAPADLSAVGGLPQIVYSSLFAPDQILVGNRAGATFHELPGSPIRVEAIDMVLGGIDAGVFGYYCTNVHSAAAFATTTYTAPLGAATAAASSSSSSSSKGK